MTATKPPVLLLGAGSQLTPFLSRRLATAGYRGTCVSRTAPPEAPAIAPEFPWRPLDLADAPEWGPMPGAIVISALPLWLLAPALSALVRAGAAQVVAFSSTSVVAKSLSPDPAERALAERLGEAEAAVAGACESAGIPWTILRPTLIYGSGRDQNVSAVARVVQRVGFFPVAHPAGGLRQPVHADDLAQAAVAAIGNVRAYGRTFNLPGGETLSYRQMVTRIFEGLGRRPRLLSLPTPLLERALPLAQRWLPQRYSPALFLRMNQDLAFDAGPAADALGYAPRPFRPEAGITPP